MLLQKFLQVMEVLLHIFNGFLFIFIVEAGILFDVTNVVSQSVSQRTDQPLAESPSQQGGQIALEAEDTIQVKTRYAKNKVYK